MPYVAAAMVMLALTFVQSTAWWRWVRPLGLSMRELAAALDVPVNRISQIVRGQRAITADTALRLARYFGTTPQLWLNLQSNSDLRQASAREGDRIRQRVWPRDHHAASATP